MQNPLPLVILTASVFLAGCSSFPNLFGSGRDEGAVAAQTAGSQAARTGDGRYFDPARNEWVQAAAEDSGGGSASRSAPAAAAAPTPQPSAPPPPPPAHASGIYNASTGEIEWNTDPSAPRPAPAAAAPKRWWWPF